MRYEQVTNLPLVRFQLNKRKCLEGIQFLAGQCLGITQYSIDKVFFFADKNHFLDWGRPISGDRYVAMEHGPVPSFIRDVMKWDGDEPDELGDEIDRRVERRKIRGMACFYPLAGSPRIETLTKSDEEYLKDALLKYGHMSFGDIMSILRDDLAYRKAMELPGINNEMDIRLWLSEDQLDHLVENPENAWKA